MSLTITHSQSSGAEVIRPEGRVDSSNAGDFEKAAMTTINAGGKALVFDLGGLTYMSSAGLRVLLVALKACKANGGKIGLADVQENVANVLKMSGFAAMFTVGDSVEDTVTALG